MIDNRCYRSYCEITVRPIHRSVMDFLRPWFQNQDWSDISRMKDVDNKAEALISQVFFKVNKFLPEKVIKVASVDEPWYTQSLKKLDRKKRREFNKK